MDIVTSELLGRVGSTAKLVWKAGWAEASAGNLSVRLGDDQELVLIQATGVRMRDLAHDPGPGTLGLFRRKGGEKLECVWGEARQTSEWEAHFLSHGILEEHAPELRAILHVHPTLVIAWAGLTARSIERAMDGEHHAGTGELFKRSISVITGRTDEHDRTLHERAVRWEEAINELLGGLEDTSVYLSGGVGIVDGMEAGSFGLGEATSRLFGIGKQAVIWPGHGVIVASEGLDGCMDILEVLDKSCMISMMKDHVISTYHG